MTCLCTPAVGSIYGFNGAICMDVWHTNMVQSARKAPTDAAFSRTAALALASLCSFFPGWQGAMSYHNAFIVET